MSSIAIFMVLGGATAFAATKIGANEIKANSIKTGKIVKEAVTTGKIKGGAIDSSKLGNGAVTSDKLVDNAVTTSKIANKAVTGAKIDAGSLGPVPNATNAQNAQNAENAVNAQNAGAVNGQTISKIAFRTTSDTGTVGPLAVFNAAGLIINVTCTNGNATVTATTTKQDSSIYINAFASGATTVAHAQQESGTFDSGDTVDVLAGVGDNNTMSLIEFDAVDGSVVTGTVNTDIDGTLKGCRVTGHAISG
jgi:hypothetical protein